MTDEQIDVLIGELDEQLTSSNLLNWGRAIFRAALREAARIAQQHEAGYARTAHSEYVTDYGADLHDAMSKGAANVATAILVAAGDET